MLTLSNLNDVDIANLNLEHWSFTIWHKQFETSSRNRTILEQIRLSQTPADLNKTDVTLRCTWGTLIPFNAQKDILFYRQIKYHCTKFSIFIKFLSPLFLLLWSLNISNLRENKISLVIPQDYCSLNGEDELSWEEYQNCSKNCNVSMTAFLWAWQVAHLMLSEWDRNVIVCSRYPVKPHRILKERYDTKSCLHANLVRYPRYHPYED